LRDGHVRTYIIDGDGRVIGRSHLEHDSLVDVHDVELWQQDRKISMFTGRQ
jgi:hypothetical protein